MNLPPVLYSDDALIAFDKPSGWLVAPDRWNKERLCLMTLVHRVLAPTVFNVHRLDADTSGVLLCARTKPALTAVAAQFAAHQADKRYLALVHQAPPEAELLLERAVVPDPACPGRMRAMRGQQPPCATHLRVLERWRHHSLIEARPLTGHTHQIRVHLAALGCPIVADPLYGDGEGLRLSALKPQYKPPASGVERPLIGRLALHADRLTIRHPTTGAPLTIQALLPKDMAVAIKYLSLTSPPIS